MWLKQVVFFMKETAAPDKPISSRIRPAAPGRLCPPKPYACVHSKSVHLCLTLCDPMNCNQALLSVGFSRQEYWSGLPCPPPEDLPDSGIKLMQSVLSPTLAGGFFVTSTTWEAPISPITYNKLFNVFVTQISSV